MTQNYIWAELCHRLEGKPLKEWDQNQAIKDFITTHELDEILKILVEQKSIVNMNEIM